MITTSKEGIGSQIIVLEKRGVSSDPSVELLLSCWSSVCYCAVGAAFVIVLLEQRSLLCCWSSVCCGAVGAAMCRCEVCLLVAESTVTLG